PHPPTPSQPLPSPSFFSDTSAPTRIPTLSLPGPLPVCLLVPRLQNLPLALVRGSRSAIIQAVSSGAAADIYPNERLRWNSVASEVRKSPRRNSGHVPTRYAASSLKKKKHSSPIADLVVP